MNPELHAFLIWKNARDKGDAILEDLRKKFELREVYEINWSSDLFSDNLTRFYGTNLPPGSFKEVHCGVGPFLLCIIEDKNPKHAIRETTKGIRSVNINTFDAKQTYRSWTGGGHRVHATDTEEEAEHDLVLLLGKNLAEISNKLPSKWNGKIKKIDSDLIGSQGWKDISQLFYVLNATVKYVVLRNFENLLDRHTPERHSDIDILTDQLEQIRSITNAKKVFGEENRVLHSIKIGSEDVLFDFRHVGDQYYDPKWSNGILNRRNLSQDRFYIPCPEDHFYSLLYHALVQKSKVADDYIERFVNLASKLKIDNVTREAFSRYGATIEILDAYMRKMGYEYTRPRDPSVFYNSEVVDLAIVKREHHLFRKKLETKNWLEAAAEIYYENKPWLFKMITNQNRSDFLFLLDIKKDDLALVVGADMGQIAIPLSRFCNVIAIENDPDKIEIMRLIAKQEDRSNIQFLMSDICDKKFENGKFDLVILNGLEKLGSHDTKDQMIVQQEILDEAYRILKPSGVLYLGALNKFSLKYLLGESVDGFQDYVYLKSELAKSIFEAETGKKLRLLTHGKKEYEEMILKSGFKDVTFLGNLPDYRLPNIVVDLSSNQSPSYVANNFYLVNEYDESNGTSSKYNEKLRHLYEIFSEQLSNFYPSYSIIAYK